jgi:hypothetical protein
MMQVVNTGHQVVTVADRGCVPTLLTLLRPTAHPLGRASYGRCISVTEIDNLLPPKLRTQDRTNLENTFDTE